MTSRRCGRWRSVSDNQTHAETLNPAYNLIRLGNLLRPAAMEAA